jgi:hypothetical protein
LASWSIFAAIAMSRSTILAASSALPSPERNSSVSCTYSRGTDGRADAPAIRRFSSTRSVISRSAHERSITR